MILRLSIALHRENGLFGHERAPLRISRRYQYQRNSPARGTCRAVGDLRADSSRQQAVSHAIQPPFGLFPTRHHLAHQPIKVLAVVVLGNMAELVPDDVINAPRGGLSRCGLKMIQPWGNNFSD